MSSGLVDPAAENTLPRNRQAASTWSAGGENYDRISRQISDAIEHCVDRLDPQPGERILDVATGTGWTARRVHTRGAKVTGIDLGIEVIQAARRLDASEAIDFRVGDAEALPFTDGEFDAVISTFGVMFCGDPRQAAAELARVCKPGGRLALAVWDSYGGVYEMFEVLTRHKPPQPAAAPSPFDWTDDEVLSDLLGDNFEFGVEYATSFYREANAEEAWEAFANGYGPIKTLIANLGESKVEKLKRDFLKFHENYQTDVGMLMPRPYTIVSGVRK